MLEKRITVTDAARGFSEIINRAYYRGESFLLTKNRRAYARTTPAGPSGATAGELADLWTRVPHLSPDEATSMAEDIERARQELPEPVDPWD